MSFDIDERLRVIVVGSPTDDFVLYVVSLLEKCEVDFVLCDDVYSAVGELAKCECGKVLAIGRHEQLSRENGRFLQMAVDKGIWCCCLADGSMAQTKRLFESGLTPRGTLVFIVNEATQIRQIISKLLHKKEKKIQGFIRDEFLTTQAELDALLGS